MRITAAQFALESLSVASKPLRFPPVGRSEDAHFSRQTARSLVERGFAEVSPSWGGHLERWSTVPPEQRTGFYIRITEAGRAALESEAAK
jgi:hypothetical protein